MVTTQKDRELEGFRNRLIEACDDQKLDPRSRQTEVASWFGIQPNATHKWFNGTGWPSMARAVMLARRLGVNTEWLITGRGQKYPSENGIDKRFFEIAVRVLDVLQRKGWDHLIIEQKIKAVTVAYKLFHDVDSTPTEVKIKDIIKATTEGAI